uniref:Uncharacterized protein n=1 Tax=Marseillevirus sp. TaxID=2809551 RepID=A0AA96ENW5_9VIRU|nr:hypothetical protein MarFTMF_458 [Marseillevirus sp.]
MHLYFVDNLQVNFVFEQRTSHGVEISLFHIPTSKYFYERKIFFASMKVYYSEVSQRFLTIGIS